MTTDNMNTDTITSGQSPTRPRAASRPTRDQIDAVHSYLARLRASGSSYSIQDALAFIHNLNYSVPESSPNHRLGSAVDLSTVEVSSSSTGQLLPPSAEKGVEGSSPGNATLVSAPATNQGASGPSIQATSNAISEGGETTPYEKLYPGFDPKEDLEVNLASRITICRWGNCQDVWCRLDKMWCDHIFGDYNTPEGVSHKEEILAPHNRLPGEKVRCLWQGCERTFPVDGLKKHVEDTHLLLYRLRCIHCGTEKRDGSYRRTHGPASMCPQNSRFQQANALVPPSDQNPQVPPYTPPTDGPTRVLDDTPHAQSALADMSSSSGPAPNPAFAYQDSLGRYLDKRLESLRSSLYGRSPASGGDVPTQPIWRTPAAILSLHPQEYKANRHPALVAAAAASAPVSSAPQFIAPDLLIARRPEDGALSVSHSGSTFPSQTRDREGEPRDPRGGRAGRWLLNS
ncbi:hypothetical protein GSI_10274 [Ganoderma sinense ZZ0214-1]|uniref:Uncharacterized protein n=1 Tax=Ganoderma sinense ZZ0214-1 TaxID=1077348 RepID=A0A2G8S032_9APHY|nr:hypothetical protein GSI_10274 [Ganoderma sinense ZZ0214-1]